MAITAYYCYNKSHPNNRIVIMYLDYPNSFQLVCDGNNSPCYIMLLSVPGTNQYY